MEIYSCLKIKQEEIVDIAKEVLDGMLHDEIVKRFPNVEIPKCVEEDMEKTILENFSHLFLCFGSIEVPLFIPLEIEKIREKVLICFKEYFQKHLRFEYYLGEKTERCRSFEWEVSAKYKLESLKFDCVEPQISYFYTPYDNKMYYGAVIGFTEVGFEFEMKHRIFKALNIAKG